jgi:DNA polymerase-1
LSAKLATVREDLDLEVKREDFRYRFHVNEGCREFLLSLDFHSLVSRWEEDVRKGLVQSPKEASSAPDAQTGSSVFQTVNTEKDFQELLAKLEERKEFGFDIETTSLNPREATLVGVAICFDVSSAYYIPVGHRGTSVPQLATERVLDGLKPFLENPKYKKVGQNLKYDWSVLRELGVHADGIGADTMVAAYVLDPEGRHNLDRLASQYLDYSVMTYEQVCGKGKDQLCFDQVPVDLATRYSAEDAWVALRLWKLLQGKLAEEKLMEVFSRVDLPLVQVLARMEGQGVCIDVDWLSRLSDEFARELAAIEERIRVYSKGPINLNSTKQLSQLLFTELGLPPQGKTKTGFSTDASVLEALAPLHEVPRLLLEYREISKLKGTYVDPLPMLRDSKTGKIHASFHQTVTATGRLSSSDPNLQNIPIRSERGRKIRKAFVPSPGNLLLAADYSQIELRLLAHMSGDPELVRSFRNDEDVHQRTAGEIFGISPSEVDERQRGIAKAINFGLMYGKTPFGLAQELKISRKEAQEIIQKYFERYSGVKAYLDGLIRQAHDTGEVTTLLGRKRKLPDIVSKNPAIRNNAERMAMNTPIQGTAADLMKLAMIQIDEELEKRGLKSKLIIQVHDEVVLDCPKDEVEQVRRMVTEVMENAMEGILPLSVPLKVNYGVGDNWMDL